eukprot:GHVP01046336.1.p1 GENE.GHVP01046336.1~~GHVP01046336.1.p1  ORF type:complete len:104 (+),score=5.72 GHVP01046336.1:772-1083(+)
MAKDEGLLLSMKWRSFCLLVKLCWTEGLVGPESIGLGQFFPKSKTPDPKQILHHVICEMEQDGSQRTLFRFNAAQVRVSNRVIQNSAVRERIRALKDRWAGPL